jgi:ATP-dependent DNA ligase
MTMDPRLAPMLASPSDEMPADLDQWRLEPKFDGWRGVIHVLETGVHIYGGRNGSDYSGKLPYITDALATVLPVGTALDGEIVGANGWGDVQGTMTRGAGAHKPSAISPALTFVCFDVILLNGQDVRELPYENRRSLLELMEWPTHTYATPSSHASAQAHLAMLDAGMEGSVLKRIDSLYTSGIRSQAWRKLKAIDSEDCTIVGFEDGKNGRAGEVGAIVVELPSGVKTTASGMTDKVRKDMLDNPDKYLGKMVEIAHNGVLDSGKLRHPRFKRMRDDRAPAPAPAPKKPRAPRATGKSMRNYGAMGDAKLLTCIRELTFKNGDAYRRVEAGRYGGSYQDHLHNALNAAASRGLSVPTP